MKVSTKSCKEWGYSFFLILQALEDDNMLPYYHPGGGMSHWGLYIICVNHSLKGTLNEDEPRVHTKPAPGYRSQISYPFRGS